MESSRYQPDQLRTPHHQSQPQQQSKPPTKFEHIFNPQLSDQQAVRTRANERISREVDYEGHEYPSESEAGDLERNQSSAYPNPHHTQNAGHSGDRNGQEQTRHLQNAGHPKDQKSRGGARYPQPHERRDRRGRARSRRVQPGERYHPPHSQHGSNGQHGSQISELDARPHPPRNEDGGNEHHNNYSLPADFQGLPRHPHDSGYRTAHAHDARGGMTIQIPAREGHLANCDVQQNVDDQNEQKPPQRSWSPIASQQPQQPEISEAPRPNAVAQSSHPATVNYIPQTRPAAQLSQNPRPIVPTPSDLPEALPFQAPIQEPAQIQPPIQAPASRTWIPLNPPGPQPDQQPLSLHSSRSPPPFTYSPDPSNGNSTNLHEITHIICPILFFLFFSIFITVSIIYSLSLHRVLPKRFLEGMGILMGLVLVSWLGVILWVKIKRVEREKRAIQCGLNRISRVYGDQVGKPVVEGHEVGWRGRVRRARAGTGTGAKNCAKTVKNIMSGFGAARHFDTVQANPASTMWPERYANDVEAGGAPSKEWISPEDLQSRERTRQENLANGRVNGNDMVAEISPSPRASASLSVPPPVHHKETPNPSKDEEIPTSTKIQYQIPKRKPLPPDLVAEALKLKTFPPFRLHGNLSAPQTTLLSDTLHDLTSDTENSQIEQYETPPRSPNTQFERTKLQEREQKSHLNGKQHHNRASAILNYGHGTVVDVPKRALRGVQSIWQIRHAKVPRAVPTSERFGMDDDDRAQIPRKTRGRNKKRKRQTPVPNAGVVNKSLPPLSQIHTDVPPPESFPPHSLDYELDNPYVVEFPLPSPNTEHMRVKLRKRERDIRIGIKRASNPSTTSFEHNNENGAPIQDLRRAQWSSEIRCENELQEEERKTVPELITERENIALDDVSDEVEEGAGLSPSPSPSPSPLENDQEEERVIPWSEFSDSYEEPRPLTVVFAPHEQIEEDAQDTYTRDSSSEGLRTYQQRKDSATIPLPTPPPSSASSQLVRNFSKKSAADSGYGSSNHQCDTISLEEFEELDVSEEDVSPVGIDEEEKRSELFERRVLDPELERKMHDLLRYVEIYEEKGGEGGEEVLKRGFEEMGWNIDRDAMEIDRWVQGYLVSGL